MHKSTVAALAMLSLGPSFGCGSAPPEVIEAFVIAMTPARDFNDAISPDYGVLELSLLPLDEAGQAVIDEGVLVDISVDTPPDTLVTPRSRTDVSPDPSAQIAAALDFDSSGSMRGNDPQRLRVGAGQAFLAQLVEGDTVGVFDFGPRATPPFVRTRILSDFGTDLGAASLAIEGVSASGGTPMYGSVIEVLEALDFAAPAATFERSLVVLGDGNPGDRTLASQACETATRLGIAVSTIGFGPAADTSRSPDSGAVSTLRNLAFCSGGGYSSVAEASDLMQAFRIIGQATRSGSTRLVIQLQPVPPPGSLVTGRVDVSNGVQGPPAQVEFTFVTPTR